MTKPLLSIIVPAAPKRMDKLTTLISRMSLNSVTHTDIPFELIIVDSSNDGEYRATCENVVRQLTIAGDQSWTIKYIYSPIDIKYYPPSLKRNQGFRIAEGEVFAMLDIDHFPSEHYIKGAIDPWLKGKAVLNIGWMIDTNKSKIAPCEEDVLRINQSIMSDGLEKEIAGIYDVFKITSPRPSDKVWLWSAPAKDVLEINAYDENYLFYSKEDDSIYNRLATKLPIHKDEYKNFCGLHLYHRASVRNDPNNIHNKKYFNKMENPVTEAIRNTRHDWGKLVSEHAYTLIDNKIHGVHEHEKWIKNHGQVRDYTQSPYWKDFGKLVTTVKQCYGDK